MAEIVTDAETDRKLDGETVQNCRVNLKEAKSGNDIVRFTDTSSSSSSSSSSERSFPRSPDGGWGWIIIAASFLAHAIVDGYAHSVGILFDYLLDEFNESKGTTAWVASLFVSMPSICGPIASILTSQFGCRRITIAGGIISAVGCILGAFSDSIGLLCLTFGVIAGFGLSLVYVPAILVVAFYFEKRRAFACGVAAAGSGIGGFIFPPLVNFLLETYSWRGTFIILGAIMLNIVICGSLFRPLAAVKLHRQRQRYLRSLERFSHASSRLTSGDALDSHPQRNHNSEEVSDVTMYKAEPISHSLIVLPTYMKADWPISDLQENPARDSQSLNNLSSSAVCMTANDKLGFQTKTEILENNVGGNLEQPVNAAVSGDVELQLVKRMKGIKKKRDCGKKQTRFPDQFLPQYRRDVCYRRSLLEAGFFLQRGQSASCPDIFVHSKQKESGHAIGHLRAAFAAMLTNIRDNVDFSIFKSPLFILFCIHSMFLYLSYDIPYVYIPDHAETVNVDEHYASLLISIIGIASTLGQIVMGYIGDQSCVNRLLFYIVMTCIAGFATLTVPLLRSFGMLAAYCAIYGFFMSANFSLTTIIVVELLGMDQLTNAYGFVSMAEGLANVFGPPLAGWLTDSTNTYNVSFVVSGVVICCSGFLLLAAPLLRRCDHIAVNNDSKSEENSDHETSSGKAAAAENLPSTSWNSN